MPYHYFLKNCSLIYNEDRSLLFYIHQITCSRWVQTILWSQVAGETEVLPDPCEGGPLHGSEVYPTGVGTQSGPALEGFLFIKK
jgi:hypothetical protein